MGSLGFLLPNRGQIPYAPHLAITFSGYFGFGIRSKITKCMIGKNIAFDCFVFESASRGDRRPQKVGRIPQPFI